MKSYLISGNWLAANGFSADDLSGMRVVRHLYIRPEGNGTFSLVETFEAFAHRGSVENLPERLNGLLAKWWNDEGRSQN